MGENNGRVGFDLRDDDLFWCAADCGWITGHSYVTYGPLAAGVGIIFEGAPDAPHQDASGRLSKTKKQLFSIRLQRLFERLWWGPEHIEGKDLSSLRLLGTVGEGSVQKHGCGTTRQSR